jgi:translation initiation factor IF-2
MAKLRVHELARELNLTNKILLDRMKKLNMSVRSHMSALDDNDVQTIRDSFIASKKNRNVEEERVKSTVIRRRRKGAKQQSEAVRKDTVRKDTVRKDTVRKDEKNETKQDRPSKDTDTKGARSDMQSEDGKLKPKKSKHRNRRNKQKIEAEKTDQDRKDDKQSEQKPDGEKTKRRRRRRKKKKDAGGEPAKIIRKPELPQEEEEDHLLKDDKEVVSDESQQSSAEIHATHDDELQSKHQDEFEQIEEEDKDQKDKPEEIEGKKKEGLEKKKKKRSKKRRKDEPAKIIRKAEPSIASTIEPEIQSDDDVLTEEIDFTRQPSREVPDQPAPQDPQKKKRKKGRKRQQPNENQDEQKFFNKRISFKKKEVVEGSALYSEKKGRGKTRKTKGGQKKPIQKAQKTQITTPKAIKRRIKIYDAIILADLAKRMGIKASDLIKKLIEMGVMATVNQSLDYDTAVLIATEFNFEVEKGSFEEDTVLEQTNDTPEDLQDRPPVVTIMGHVDHGKTSLLDAIRETRITASEAGGITQHIGAYNVQTDRGQIVFLDTPGHEAFTSMRARGAQITDIVVLVVAADDGVMPQTIEAINHSKAANVPILVAVNKIDKAGADPDKVKRELSDYGLMPEDWGGETIFTHVSAKMKQGIDDLLEMILLQSEVMELKANPNKHARGHVVEAKIDSGRGAVATVLIQEGTLHKGDPIVCGVHSGKVRALINDRNMPVKSAGPSIPVEILGLTGVPMAGDELIAVADEKTAKQVSNHRSQKQRMLELAKSNRISLDNFFEKMQSLDVKSLNLIVKTDVHGSIDAINESLHKLSSNEVKIDIVHSATGTITESDISLAAVSDAIVIGFNVRPSTRVQELANEENVDIRFYDIIYNLINDIKDAVVGMMESTFEDVVLGHAEVREIFSIPKIGIIAGSYIKSGKVERNQQARLLREGVVIYTGKISSLKRFKEDAKEVSSGYECGIGIENYNDIKVGDVIECFHLKEIKPMFEE